MNLKTSGLTAAIALALLPLATRTQAAPTPASSEPPRFQTTFTSPLKIVGADGHFTVTPRNSATEWSCIEGQQTQILVGSPTVLVYFVSPDGNLITALANGGSLRVDIAKSQYAYAAYGDPIDNAPMKAFTTVPAGAPTLLGASPTTLATGFELLYSSAVGLTVSLKTGQRTLGVFTANAMKWQLGFFPLDDMPAATTDASGATPPPARGDVVITGGGCKGSPVAGTAMAGSASRSD